MNNSYKEYSDTKLVSLYINNRDKNAFDEIFKRYFEPTYRFIYSRVGNKTWSEDICSETFYTLIDVLESYTGQSKLQSFIIGISINKIRHFWYYNKKKNEIQFEDEDDFFNTDNSDESEEEIENEKKDEKNKNLVANILELMVPPIYKQVLIERFIKEHSIKETAQILEISEENVRVIQHRAIKKALKNGIKFYEK